MRSPTRRQLFRIVSVLLLTPTTLTSEAATVPTVKCTRVGQTIIWRNKKYTCIRLGNKLIWNKGVAIAVPKKAVSTPEPQTSIYIPAAVEFLICASSDLKTNQPLSFQNPSLNDPSRGYILIRREKEVVAFSNRCTHEGAEVEISKGELVCFRHLSYFDLASGKVLSGPATRELKSYKTSEHDSKIFVIDAA